jgi:hypothetical protein
MRLSPQIVRDWFGIDTRSFPGFVAVAMDFAMVPAAERDGELIADLTAERAALCESQVMGVAGLAAADQTRLPGDEPDVVAIADAARLRESKHGLVDGAGSFDP